MAFPTFPTQPDPWPVRTQDQETFDTAVAGTFNFYDGLETWADGFETEASSLAAALIAANLPSLTGQGGKAVFVNDAGTDVELARTVQYDAAVASPFFKVGDIGTTTWGNAITDTIAVTSDTLLIFFASVKLSSTNSASGYSTRILFDSSVITPGGFFGSITPTTGGSASIPMLGATTKGSGSYSLAIEAQCGDDVVVDRVNLLTLGFKY